MRMATGFGTDGLTEQEVAEIDASAAATHDWRPATDRERARSAAYMLESQGASDYYLDTEMAGLGDQ